MCPFIFGASENAKRRIALYQSKWPGIWKAFEHAVRRWFIEKGSKNELRSGQICQNADQFWERYITGGSIQGGLDSCPK